MMVRKPRLKSAHARTRVLRRPGSRRPSNVETWKRKDSMNSLAITQTNLGGDYDAYTNLSATKPIPRQASRPSMVTTRPGSAFYRVAYIQRRDSGAKAQGINVVKEPSPERQPEAKEVDKIESDEENVVLPEAPKPVNRRHDKETKGSS